MGYRPMSRILTIANQKGGVGKTTTAVNLAASLAAAEHRTLLVDVDPQGNAGSAFGIRRDESERSIYEVLLDGLPMPEAIRKTELKFLDLVPASRHLVGADRELGHHPDVPLRIGVDDVVLRRVGAGDEVALRFTLQCIEQTQGEPPGWASSLITGQPRQHCCLRLPCHEDRTGGRDVASPGVRCAPAPVSAPAADQPLPVQTAS